MFKNFKRFTKEYFSYSLVERKAIWIIILVIIVLILIPNVFSFFHKNTQSQSNINFAEIDSNFKLKQAKKTTTIRVTQPFDPNKLSKTDWIEMGLNAHTAQIIENYTKKGGRFWEKSDLLKIHDFDSAFYGQICPFIEIENTDTFHKKVIKSKEYKAFYEPSNKTNKKKELIIEINSADSAQFEKLSGIGSILASRIIKFRNLLGGFYSVNQLNEVHGLRPETYNIILPHIYCDSLKINKLDLNSASESEFRKHPYIGKYKAGLIIKYRNFAKKIANPSELVVNNVITPSEFQKLHNYLK
jgi:competence protein ComEA